MDFSKDELAILTLDMIKGISLGKKHKILRMLDSPCDLFDGFCFDQIDFLKSDAIMKIQVAFSTVSQNILLSHLQSLGCEVCTMESFDYPDSLKEIYEPPLCLYYRGNIKLLHGEIITICGTRFSTIYGKDVASKFVSKLCEKNVVVASGVADGIDRDVLDAMEEEQGTAILITAGGIDKIVPSINKSIAERVTKNGLILSEQRPDVSPQKFHYELRNRIFVGISKAVVVCEAEKASSSLHVASEALEYGKEVFAVPGSILSASSKGTNALIRNNYAVALTDEKQLFDVLNLEYSFASETKTISVDQTDGEILACLEKGRGHVSEISEDTGLAPNMLLPKLLMLEGKGIIRSVGGNRYEKRNY